jgi:flagellar biosynthesis chaperone FliJ
MATATPASAPDADEEEDEGAGGGGGEGPSDGVAAAAAAAAIVQEDGEGDDDDDDEEGDDCGDRDRDREDRRDLLPAPSPLVPRPPSSLRQRLPAETEARKAAQASRYDLQIAFSRLKTFAFEAVRQRDDAVRLRSEAESSKEELERQLGEAVRWSNVLVQQRNTAVKERDEALRQRNDAVRSLEEASLHKDIAIHGRDNSRSDMEAAAKLLVAGADLITSKVSSIKKFPIALPRSSSYTGLSAIAYGFTRRSEEIVNELLSRYEIVVKERSAFSEHTDHQNYQAAIKVSELESKIEVLEGNLSKQTSEFENCLKIIAEKEKKISEIEFLASKKKAEDDNENLRLRNALKLAEAEAENVNLSSNELSKLISKLHETVANRATVFFPAHLHSSAGASSANKANDCIRDCIDKSNEILKHFSKLAVTWEEQLDLRKKALEDTEGTISRLIVEKKEITNFLESAIAAKQEMLEAFSKLSLDSNNNLNTITKNRDTRLVTISGTANSLDEELKVETASRVCRDLWIVISNMVVNIPLVFLISYSFVCFK